MTPGATDSLDLPTQRASREFGRRLASCLAARDLVVFSGPHGSGKTVNVRAVCRALGLPEEERVTSPTFTLVNEYATNPPLCHADLYRLNDSAEVEMLGLDSQRAAGNLMLVEWGEPYIDVLGGDALVVELRVAPRRAALRATAARSAEILAKLAAW
jgi:tRNA threonylcarbamoyladenosine biosynthesis protein TsaE